jgi:glycogen operon protein
MEYNLPVVDTICGFDVRPGFYEINGASVIPGGVSFTVHSQNASSCELLLYRRGEEQPYAVLPFPDSYRIGSVYSMIVFGLKIDEFEYAYRLDGPYHPAAGLLFDRTRPLLDPYARIVSGQSIWGESRGEHGCYRARVVKDNFDWGKAKRPLLDMHDLIIYELHVRGFTRHASSGVCHPGTFDGLREKIPYLKELGITAVELMPVFEFDEMMDQRKVDGELLMDYWGYNTVSFFAPNSSYSSGGESNQEGNELKLLVRELHAAGIEVILDVVFNHTAEGNENGPVFSFKGFDNNIYYMLTPDGHYYNFSGCGNTLNCNHPVVQQMILECLHYWTVHYRIDGFRFDLASILGRNEDGSPMNRPPLLRNLAADPILADVKLIAEAWDAGGMYQVGSFPAWHRWAEWNGKYRDDIRSFLKGDYWYAPEAAKRICGSPDLYTGQYRGYNSSINFLTCHDGFTLHDLYAYSQKHNEKNGWNNTDGADDNRSWNCGVEGETDDPEILELRKRLTRNACAILMCSRGTPMFYAGDEFGNSQQGNNNAYCQDNEISWLNWHDLEKNQDLYEFFRYMIHFRKVHPAIGGYVLPISAGRPTVTVHTENPDDAQISADSRYLGVMFSGWNRENGYADYVYLAVNVYWEQIDIRLPQLPTDLSWKLCVDTSKEHAIRDCLHWKDETTAKSHCDMVWDDGIAVRDPSPSVETFEMRPRSVAVFAGRR